MQETNAKLISAGWMCVGFWIVLVELLTSQTPPANSHLKNEPDAGKLASSAVRDRALIVVGLPGDAEHEVKFRELARTYHDWLTGSLGFPEAGVRVLFGAKGEPELKASPATSEAIAREATEIRAALAPEGRLWVFILGHANLRDGHFYLHLSGPDPSELELAKLFEGITAREQVFWVTTSGSGGFLAGLSAKGRIVITATTADGEFNETEFPYALADLCRQTSAAPEPQAEGKVSVWDLFVRLAALVDARFAADERTPTEHALIDDNGDRAGSERPDAAGPGKNNDNQKDGKPRVVDGELARKTILPLKIR